MNLLIAGESVAATFSHFQMSEPVGIPQSAEILQNQGATASYFRFFNAELPEVRYLTGVAHNRYQLIPAYIDVTIEREDDGSFVVSNEKSYAYGTGKSIKKAIVDFEHSLIGRYEYLSSNAPILSQALQEQLSYLRTLIRQK